MKAALFSGGKDIRVSEVPDPVPGPGEVLVKVRAAAICGSDLHPYHADQVWDPPQIRGHELAGEVAGVGEGVTSVQVGQRVGVEPLWACGKCEFCLSGRQQVCSQKITIGLGRPGGFAQYTLAAEHLIHPLPDHVSFDAAALLDVYGCAVHAHSRVPARPGDTVAVLGTGAIGLSIAEVANLAGAQAVLMVGRRQEALDFARQITDVHPINMSEGDAVQQVLDWSNGRGVDVVYEAVGGSSQVLNLCLGMVTTGGRVCAAGGYTALQAIDARRLMGREITIAGSQSYDQRDDKSEFQIALGMVAAAKCKPEKLVTHRLPLDRIAEAFELSDKHAESNAVRVLLDPWA